MRLLLDTNAYSDLAKGHRRLAERVRRAEELLLSTIVVGELLGGFHRGSRFDENLAMLERFLAQPRVRLLAVTWITADRYGRIYSSLARRGEPIPTNDMWIAAQAMETGAELISSDAHFRHVEGLAWNGPARA